MSKSSRGFNRLLALLTVLALLGFAFMFRNLLLPYPARALVRDDRPDAGAGAIVLLMGDYTPTRAKAAAELFQRGVAPAILVARELPEGWVKEGSLPSLVDVHKQYLARHGVPPEAIVELGGCRTTSTLEEARCAREWLEKQEGGKPARVVVVTSWYHSSRAAWLFGKAFDGSGIAVQAAPASGPESNAETWWRGEDTFLAVFNEYLKWLYWLTKTVR